MKKNFNKFILPFFALLIAIGAHAQTKIITTVAGTGVPGYSGDGAAATAAELNVPSGVAVDDSGKIYIVDKENARIRKISVTGKITTIGGNGATGYSGNNIAATAATLSPTGIAIDLAGNLFIADEGNNCVRKINTLGIITTVAGDTAVGFSGDNGPAVDAELSTPTSVAVDKAGNLYIADENNNRIRKVTASGIITTVAGGGTSGLGNGGPATAAQLSSPSGISVDTSGNLFIADQADNIIRKVTTTGIIYTIAGSGASGYTGDGGPATAATFLYPVSVAADDSGNIYISEGNNNAIRKINDLGIISTVAGNGTIGYSGDGGPATAAKINNPKGIAVNTAGTLYIADIGNNRIRKVAAVSKTGIAQVGIPAENIELMPNPCNGIITVKGSFGSLTGGDVYLQVTDMLGRSVYKNTLQSQNGLINTQIALTDIIDGTYLLHVWSGNETKVLRFVVRK